MISKTLLTLIKYYLSKQHQTMRSRHHIDNNFPQLPKYKYSFNQKVHDLNISSPLENRSMFSKVARHHLTPNKQTIPQKIKSGSNFSLQKINSSILELSEPLSATKNPKLRRLTRDNGNFKLPTLKKRQQNPQQPKLKNTPETFYQQRVYKALKQSKQSSYLMNLARQHFIQTIDALKIGKGIKLNGPKKEIKLNKKNPKLKTIYLDMDETLIHCDQNSNSYTVKLNFPIEGGGFISAGIRIRPHCDQFLRELAGFAEVIVFTASAASYADIVLDHLDPNKKYFAHRLYRQHCTLQKGYFVKDLRVINRRLEDVLLVDNSAFSFMLQPENGVPILPFYHLAKDKELLSLLQFLKRAVSYGDMRELIRQIFFFHKYLGNNSDSKRIFQEHFQQEEK